MENWVGEKDFKKEKNLGISSQTLSTKGKISV